jgi:nicotinamidase-related amidase
MRAIAPRLAARSIWRNSAQLRVGEQARASGSSGLAKTDLDLHLKQHGIQKLVILGLSAHSIMLEEINRQTQEIQQ